MFRTTGAAFIRAVLITSTDAFTRSAASAAIAVIVSASGGSITFFDLLREECRKGRADRVLLRLNLGESGRKNTKLYRNNNLFLTGYAKRDDKTSADFSVCADAEISSHIIGSKPCFACGVAEFRKTRQECSIIDGRHAHFKEIGKYERLRSIRDVYFG